MDLIQYSQFASVVLSFAALYTMPDPQTTHSDCKPPVTNRTISRSIAVPAFVAGLVLFLWGLSLETQNPRTNAEDDFAWLILGVGVSLSAFAIALWFVRPRIALIAAIVAPPLAFSLASVLFIACVIAQGLGNRHHQSFAANGLSQITPARQMDELYDDCRRYITYDGNFRPEFNSVAYFGGRYELTMQVPVEIKSASSGSMIGEPRFHLHEVSDVSVSPTGEGAGASFSRDFKFGLPEWEKVYQAKGDFSVIGFTINPTPVPDFEKYTAAERPSE